MEHAASPIETLACHEIVLRLALKREFVSGDSVDAFLLRPSDNGYLSVYRQAKVSLEECSKTFKKVHGAFSLHAGRVRDIHVPGCPSLEVIADESPVDKCPGHAAILNLPDPQADFERAQRLASLLKRCGRQLV
jgi:hypothetical protein